MGKLLQSERLIALSRRLPWVATCLALFVLACVVGFTTLQVRHRIRAQLAGRDGEALHALTLMNYAQEAAAGLEGPLTDPATQLSVVLKSAGLKGVLGVRLFDAQGHFVESFPPYVTEHALTPDALPTLERLEPASRFHPEVAPEELFYAVEEDQASQPLPVLEVNIPLHEESGPLAGVAQYLLEGHSLAADYARLDRSLTTQALTAFGAGAVVLLVGLGWAFQRLKHANQLLAERTDNLVKANQELALAAKTSALGAVTAHLIHGLKNPLAGLQSFVASHGASVNGAEEADWHQAVASTRRMQTMINQVTSVLREQQFASEYEITFAELAELVKGRVAPLANDRSVRIACTVHHDAALPNRVANLVALILTNLAENAIHATSRDRTVALDFECAEDSLCIEVRDHGSGFPADTPLFMPCASRKEGGSGIGLALCKQLANHLGASLDLTNNSPQGCVFTLRLARTRNGKSHGAPELAARR